MNNESKGCSAGLIIVIAAVVILLLANKVLLWVALGLVGLVVAAAVVLIITMEKKDKLKKKEIVADGVTLGDVDKIIADGTSRLQAVRTNYYKLKSSDMRDELDAISDRCKKIFKMIKEDPKDVKIASRFLNMLFMSLEQIVAQSVHLYGADKLSDEGNKALEDAKEGLVMLKNAADSQINKLYENNILDLDVEVEVLRKTLQAKGLIGKDNNSKN